MAQSKTQDREPSMVDMGGSSAMHKRRSVARPAHHAESGGATENHHTHATVEYSSDDSEAVSEKDHQPKKSKEEENFIAQFSRTKGPPQIALIALLFAIGLGTTIAVVPVVMSDRFARTHHGYEGAEDCSSFGVDEKPAACFDGSSDAQSAAATSNLVSNGLTFLTSSIVGSASDERGRKGIMLMGLSLGLLPPTMLLLVQMFPRLSPWWYYGVFFVTGLVNWVAVALSSLADVLPEHFRAPGNGLVLAGFMLGFCLSPILAFFMSNFQLSFISFLAMMLSLIFTVMTMPETLPPGVAAEARAQRELEEQQPIWSFVVGTTTASGTEAESPLLASTKTGSFDSFDLEDSRAYEEAPGTASKPRRRRRRGRAAPTRSAPHPFLLLLARLTDRLPPKGQKALRLALRPFKEMSILTRDSFFQLLSLLAFFSGMVSQGGRVLLVYYVEERLGFTPQDVSIMLLLGGIFGLVAQGYLVKVLNEKVGEKFVVSFCFLLGAIVNTLYGVATSKLTIYAGASIASIASMLFPTVSAIKANNVEETEQGRIQGAFHSLHALANGLGPILLTFVYSQTKDSFLGPGAMFLFSATLYLVAIPISCSLPRDRTNSKRSSPGGASSQN